MTSRNSMAPKWSKLAYKSTQVNWAKTQTQIYKMLNSMGIFDTRFTNIRDRFCLEFIVPFEGGKPRAIRIVVPLKYEGENDDKRTKELNIIHRVLLNHLKAKFVAIASGLTEFDQEFMAHLLVTDKSGNSRTMGEIALPQYQTALTDGHGEIKLLPSNPS